jgi:hypothetical protein
MREAEKSCYLAAHCIDITLRLVLQNIYLLALALDPCLFRCAADAQKIADWTLANHPEFRARAAPLEAVPV